MITAFSASFVTDLCSFVFGIGFEQLNKAADAFTQATSVQPSMPQAWKGLSDVHLAQKQWEKYAQALERMFEIAVR
jgi:hypothetical protein